MVEMSLSKHFPLVLLRKEEEALGALGSQHVIHISWLSSYMCFPYMIFWAHLSCRSLKMFLLRQAVTFLTRQRAWREGIMMMGTGAGHLSHRGWVQVRSAFTDTFCCLYLTALHPVRSCPV